MSMLGRQVKELRALACGLRNLYENGTNLTRVQVADLTTAVEVMSEAADTIESLRDRIQRAEEDARIIEVETSHIDIEQGEVITRFVPAELDYIEDKSRWAELFGTPERAARTLEKQCDPFHCVVCPAYHRAQCDEGDYDKLLEWLRGER